MRDTETLKPKAVMWNSPVINFINYTCAFPAVTSPNVFSENVTCIALIIQNNWKHLRCCDAIKCCVFEYLKNIKAKVMPVVVLVPFPKYLKHIR